MIIRASLSLYHSFGLVFLVICGLIASQNIALRQALASSPICQTIDPTHSPRVQQWIATQCQVHAAIFGDNTEPSAGFQFTAPMTQTGTYFGTDHLGRQVAFQATLVFPMNNQAMNPLLAAQGVECSAMVGRFSGPNGMIPVSAMLIRPSMSSPYILQISAVLTDEQVAETESVATGLDSTSQIFDAETGQPFVLDDSGNGSGDSSIAGGQPGSVDPECVRRAVRDYNRDVGEVNDQAVLCAAAALALYLACLAPFAATALLIGPLSLIAASIAILGCLAAFAITSGLCLGAALISLAAKRAAYRDRLMDCGLLVVEL